MIKNDMLDQARCETAHELANAMINVINAHMETHGTHDPELHKILLAAMLGVVAAIEEAVPEEFSSMLCDLLAEAEEGGW